MLFFYLTTVERSNINHAILLLDILCLRGKLCTTNQMDLIHCLHKFARMDLNMIDQK